MHFDSSVFLNIRPELFVLSKTKVNTEFNITSVIQTVNETAASVG